MLDNIIVHKIEWDAAGHVHNVPVITTKLLYLLSWQPTGGDIDPIGLFSTRDKAIDASRTLALGFVLWGENTSCETILGVDLTGRFWLTEMTLDHAPTLEDV